METFAASRSRLLDRLDAAYNKLRVVVSDPQWANNEYKTYQEALADIQRQLDNLRRLNSIQMEAQ